MPPAAERWSAPPSDPPLSPAVPARSMPVPPLLHPAVRRPRDHVRHPRRDLVVAPGTTVGLRRRLPTDRAHEPVPVGPTLTLLESEAGVTGLAPVEKPGPTGGLVTTRHTKRVRVQRRTPPHSHRIRQPLDRKPTQRGERTHDANDCAWVRAKGWSSNPTDVSIRSGREHASAARTYFRSPTRPQLQSDSCRTIIEELAA